MSARVLSRMARKPLPAKNDEPSGGTRQIRVSDDLGEMIAWIVRIEGGTSATLTDPLLRPAIAARYEQIRPAVETIKKAELTVRKAEQEAAAKLKGRE